MTLLVCLAISLFGLFSTSALEPPACVDIPHGFVALHLLDANIIMGMRYAHFHNFAGRPIEGYLQPVCILTAQAAKALLAAQKEFMSMKPPFTLKMYDCYRPQMAVDYFMGWAQDLNDTVMKEEFYPTLNKSHLFSLGYIAKRSNHSCGSTFDGTIVPYPPPKQEQYHFGQPLTPCFDPLPKRFEDNSLDMGTGFDCFDPRAHTNSTDITAQQMKNRKLYQSVLEKNGFVNYPGEWWHFTLHDQPYPNTYFNFLVSCNATGRLNSKDIF
ncbi:D-alanyl-D-alanine dipeptidase-like [Corticium candelabrum]|uniref:D-alanyl-D-alanine dipeptidase-like n=1 Tax=Corticium candelabrum TaxID=121492 RepID=UPI002E272909|nr:D-alanyl-D-alanine dipeptidase-like [Corticium candelabrum]